MGVFEDHQKNYGDHRQRANNRASKYNKTVQDAYRKYLDRVSPMQAEKYQNEVGKMQKVYVKSNFETNYRKMGESGNLDGMGVLLESAKILFPKPEWDDLNANKEVDALIWQADKSMDMEDYDNALVAMNPIDMNTLSDSRREAVKTLKIRASAGKSVNDESLRQEVWDMMSEKKYRTAQLIVDSSALDTTGQGGKQQMTSMINSAMDRDFAFANAKTTAAKAKAKEDIQKLKQGNSIIGASVEKGIDTDYTKYTPESIWGLVAKGLGTEEASRLVTRWHKYDTGDKTVTNPIAKKYIDRASALMSAGTFGKTDKESTSERYLGFKITLDKYIEVQGDNLNDNEAFLFFAKLLRETTGAGWGYGKSSGAEILTQYEPIIEAMNEAD